ncbi:MAG: hypothetical protein JXR86_00555 [Spirochaetales bacterium]|nr:hypothetical protein [Spirochaetales bacterium]
MKISTLKKLAVPMIAMWLAVSCSSLPEHNIRKANESLYILEIKSEALTNNQIDEKLDQTVAIMLPPGYSRDRQYPFVYFGHGYGGSFLGFINYQQQIYQAMASGDIRPFIIITLNSHGKYGGTFYADSPVLGNWETHIIGEVIPLVEKYFGKKGLEPQRGIAGFSMGGTGALNLALGNPGMFKAVWAFAPGVYRPDELSDAYTSWRGLPGFYKGYSLAWAGEERLLLLDGSESEMEYIGKLGNGFGNWEDKFARYRSSVDNEMNIRLVIGINDNYGYMKRGVEYLADFLEDRDFLHEYETPPISHRLDEAIVADDMLPYFDRSFE